MILILKSYLGNKNAFTCTLCKNVITDLESQITDPSNEQQVSFLHSMEKKSTFLPYHVKKNHSTLEVDT